MLTQLEDTSELATVRQAHLKEHLGWNPEQSTLAKDVYSHQRLEHINEAFDKITEWLGPGKRPWLGPGGSRTP